MTTSVTYHATLDLRRQTVLFVSGLLWAERQRRATRTGRRALGSFDQAVLVLRWFLDGTRMAALARDNTIGVSTAYRYRHEAITVLAAHRPGLGSALLAAKAAGHPHVSLDGTLIDTDRCATGGPTRGVDLWWSGKHHRHGGNIQVVSAPDGWPLWTSPVRPGREHDITCLATHSIMLPALGDWVDDGRPVLADLGYQGEAATFTLPVKTPAGARLSDDAVQLNLLQAYARGPGRTSQLATEDEVQGSASCQSRPVAHR